MDTIPLKERTFKHLIVYRVGQSGDVYTCVWHDQYDKPYTEPVVCDLNKARIAIALAQSSGARVTAWGLPIGQGDTDYHSKTHVERDVWKLPDPDDEDDHDTYIERMDY